ncbi:MAG: TlpA family protein disulfide reductase [Acidimicrobiia bacterium]|nr:TlpA family protein disulfide reductase [Acidimicrobiia bacterium]
MHPVCAEHPALAEFHARHADDPDFAMVGIVRDDTEEAARGWVEDKGVSWTTALDPGDRAALDFATTGQPETYAIDPTGVVVGKQLGEVDVDDLEALLARARGTG